MTPRRVARYPLSRKPILPALAMVASLVTGCADPSARDSVVEPKQALLAKEGRVDTSPRASLVWADSVVVNGTNLPAGIRGDGRLKNGSPSPGTPSNEYQGAWCGVTAFASGADLDFKPNSSWTTSMQSACGSQRLYNFYWSGPGAGGTPNGPHSIARGLWSLAAGQSVSQWEGFGVQLHGMRHPDVQRQRSIRAVEQSQADSAPGRDRERGDGTTVADRIARHASGGVRYIQPQRIREERWPVVRSAVLADGDRSLVSVEFVPIG